jgi:tetratricopeptide (TPR) repeat protein
MNKNLALFLGTLAVALVAALGIFFVMRQGATMPASSTGTTTPPASSTTPGYTIEPVPVDTKIPLPNLDRKIQFGASVPADFRAELQAQVNTAVAHLKADPTDAPDWYNLAIFYHEAEDYQGAAEIWQFLTEAAPKDTTAYENLGKLYHLDLKDFPKAEMYFKEAIAVDPGDLSAYVELYQLYLYSYKQNTSAAVDTLTSAGQHFSTSTTPYDLLGQYYRDKGDSVNARAAFQKAIDIARANGDITAMDRIGDELSKVH